MSCCSMFFHYHFLSFSVIFFHFFLFFFMCDGRSQNCASVHHQKKMGNTTHPCQAKLKQQSRRVLRLPRICRVMAATRNIKSETFKQCKKHLEDRSVVLLLVQNCELVKESHSTNESGDNDFDCRANFTKKPTSFQFNFFIHHAGMAFKTKPVTAKLLV